VQALSNMSGNLHGKRQRGDETQAATAIIIPADGVANHPTVRHTPFFRSRDTVGAWGRGADVAVAMVQQAGASLDASTDRHDAPVNAAWLRWL